MKIEDAIIESILTGKAVDSSEGPVRALVMNGLATLYFPRTGPTAPWRARKTFPVRLSGAAHQAYKSLQGALISAHNTLGDAIDYGDYKTPRYRALQRVEDAKKALRAQVHI